MHADVEKNILWTTCRLKKKKKVEEVVQSWVLELLILVFVSDHC